MTDFCFCRAKESKKLGTMELLFFLCGPHSLCGNEQTKAQRQREQNIGNDCVHCFSV